MKLPLLPVAWVALPLLFVVLLVWEVKWWGTLAGQSAQVRREVARVERQILADEREMLQEMQALSELIGQMQQWSVDGADPSAFLTSLSDLAQGSRLKIMAIGPLERKTAPQFRKSWHTVQVQAPYSQLRTLAARIEREGGILEDVSIGLAPEPAGRKRPRKKEVEARFKLTTMELTPESKAILKRTLAMTRPAGEKPAQAPPTLRLPLPKQPEGLGPPLRDPFAFVAKAPSPKPVKVAAKPKKVKPRPVNGKPRKPLPPIDVKGIMSFPGGYLAIVNGQIVKVGDLVKDYQVERITEREVVLRRPGDPPRSVRLPGIGPELGERKM